MHTSGHSTNSCVRAASLNFFHVHNLKPAACHLCRRRLTPIAVAMSARQVARLEAAAGAVDGGDHETGATSSEEEAPAQRTFNAFAVSVCACAKECAPHAVPVRPATQRVPAHSCHIARNL